MARAVIKLQCSNPKRSGMIVLAEEVQREDGTTTLGRMSGVVVFQASAPGKLQIAGRNRPKAR